MANAKRSLVLAFFDQLVYVVQYVQQKRFLQTRSPGLVWEERAERLTYVLVLYKVRFYPRLLDGFQAVQVSVEQLFRLKPLGLPLAAYLRVNLFDIVLCRYLWLL